MFRRATAVLIVLFFMLIPYSALAEEGSVGGELLPEVVHNPIVQRVGLTDTYFVWAPSNEFDAALAIIGETSTKIQLDTPKYTALSNESTGGDFYDLAQLCYSAEDGNPVNPANLIWYPMVMSKVDLFGASHVWFCEATEEQIRAARRDYLTVLEGGSLGGGGGLSTSILLTGEGRVYRNASLSDAGTLTLNLSQEIVDRLESYNAYSNLYVFVCSSLRDRWYNDLGIYIIKTNQSVTYVKHSLGYGDIYDSSSGTNVRTEYFRYEINVPAGSMVYGERTSSISWNNAFTSIDLNSISLSILDGPKTSNFYGHAIFTNADSSGGPGGDNNWPDPTPIPKPIAPEVPSPEVGDPVIDPPDPVDITFSPTFVYEPTGTSPTDYTPWLRAILQALNTIIDDMATHCDHIRVAIRDWTQWLSQRIDYLMYEYLGDLQTYLHQLFEWLADEISFNFEDGEFPLYNDSRLIAWLRRIYYQLGSPVNINTGVPSDKDVEQGFDFWAWLLNLVNGLLGGIIEDFVGDVGGFLAELVGTFPFSVPWDILAYLTLLSAQRETPRIVVTIPAVTGWWSSYDIDIDCAPFDGAAAAVRSMQLIWWGFVLVMRTSWLDEIFKGATSLVTGFFDRVTGKAVTE